MIKVDDREDEKIRKALTKEGLEFTIEHLETGDVVDIEKSVCIERKAIADFVMSVMDGRLFEQTIRMCEQFTHCFIIVVGEVDELFWVKIKWDLNHHYGTIASLLCKTKVKIVQVKNNSQFALLCKKIMEKADGTALDIPILKTNRDNIHLAILCQIPGISVNKGKKILEHYPTIHDVFNATKEQLMDLEGIGETIAQNIKAFF